MECSQNDVDKDFSAIRIQNSELDVSMDAVISGSLKDKTELDVLSNLMTALGSSVSNVSVNTAMSVVTVETNLHADADPPLERRMSFSTASEMSFEETFDDENDIYFNGMSLSPVKVKENENGIVGFEMQCDGGKVDVVDSIECLALLDAFSPEPVHFDPRIYLGVPLPTSDPLDLNSLEPNSELSSEDVTTAPLGPSFEDFAQYLLDLESLNSQ